MPTVTTLYQLECEAAYHREGVARAMEILKRYAPFFEHQSDGVTRTAIGDLTNAAQAIKGAAGNLYAVVIVSPSSPAATADAYVQIFNVAAASVTVGTTAPVMVLPCPFTKSAVYLMLPGDDDGDLFSTAISTAATTTPTGGAALGAVSLPDVIFVSA